MTAPWDQLAPAVLGTCEPAVAGWVRHPAETVSALAYGLVAYDLRRRGGRDRTRPARALPALLATVGATSVLCHASMTALAQTADVAAIALFTGYILAATLVHRGQVAADTFGRLATGLATTGAAVSFLDLRLGLAVLVGHCFVIMGLWRGDWMGPARRDTRRAVALLLAGAPLLALDHLGIGCVTGPGAHLAQPHVGWHLLSAACAVYVCRAEHYLEGRWRGAAPHSPPAPPPTVDRR